MNQFFASGGQSIGASASVLPMNMLGWLPLGLTSLISLWSKELSRVFCSTTVRKHQFFSTQPSLWSIKKIWTIALTRWIFTSKWCLFFFNMLCRFVIAFLPRSKCLLISRLQSPSAVILEKIAFSKTFPQIIYILFIINSFPSKENTCNNTYKNHHSNQMQCIQ